MLKSTITTLSFVALFALSTAATAQEKGSLALDLSPSDGPSGMWAIVNPGDMCALTVSQQPAETARPATIYIFISGVKELGQLDVASAVLLAQGKTENDFGLKLQIPQMAEAAFSVQALAIYGDGSYATSPVLTVFVVHPLDNTADEAKDENPDQVATNEEK